MKKLSPWFILSLLYAINITSSAQGFTVSGTKLLDDNGNEFVIRGMNMPFIWFPKQTYKSLDNIAELGVNSVRIVWQTKGTATQLDSVIQRCIDLKMIPMVELHDVTGSRSTDKLLETVSYYLKPDILAIIKKYRKYLLVNLANEWGNHTVNSAYWKKAYQRAVDTLRAAGIKTTLVIDAPGWGQNITPILEKGNELLQADPQKNILFSVHIYGSWNDSLSIENKLQEAHDKNLPLIVGEFGYNYKDGNNNLGCKVNHRKILSTCQKLNYGYMPWSWTGNNEENAWLDIADFKDWKTLTRWGNEVFDSDNGIRKTAKRASVFE